MRQILILLAGPGRKRENGLGCRDRRDACQQKASSGPASESGSVHWVRRIFARRETAEAVQRHPRMAAV